MNDKNKIDLSIEMYEDLKETLVKAIKNAKAGGVGNAGCLLYTSPSPRD